jgi:hypothetical protein
LETQGINALITLAGVVGGVVVVGVIAVKIVKFHRTMKEIGTPCSGGPDNFDEMMRVEKNSFNPMAGINMSDMPGNIFYAGEPKNK